MSAGRLGLLDWGIGGLDVLAKLRAAGVGTPVLYVSDAGAVPYGQQSGAALSARVCALLDALRGHGCTEVIVGCNAASTVLSSPGVRSCAARLQRVLGVIDPGIAATLAAGVREVVVLGGVRTIDSGIYGRGLRLAGIEVREVVAQPLSALIEAGVLGGPVLDAALASIVAPVRDATTLVSACTHYLAVESALRAALPQLHTIIDPAAALVEQHFVPAPSTRTADVFWTTGDPAASQTSARRAFGVEARFEAAGDQLPPPLA